jgi:hypothetical protein
LSTPVCEIVRAVRPGAAEVSIRQARWLEFSGLIAEDHFAAVAMAVEHVEGSVANLGTSPEAVPASEHAVEDDAELSAPVFR